MKRLIVLLVLTGCGPGIESTEIVERGPMFEGQVGCTHYSYCYTCLPGFDGKLTCRFKMSAMCPGHADAILQHVTVKTNYDDGTSKLTERVVEIKRGKCE